MSRFRHTEDAGSMIGRVALVLILSLCWVQLSIAAHQFDHAAGDGGSSCELCLQFDRSDDAPGVAAPLLPEGMAPGVAHNALVMHARSVAVPAFRSRAPPLVLAIAKRSH